MPAMPRSRAMRPACTGPAPPKASSMKSRKSCPRMVEMALIASSIFTSMMRTTPSARAHRLDGHHRNREVASFDLAAAGDEGLAVLDQGHVAGGPAHVEGDEVLAAGHATGIGARGHAAGRAREHRRHRLARRGGE